MNVSSGTSSPGQSQIKGRKTVVVVVVVVCAFFCLSFYFSSPNLSGRRLDVYTRCDLSANFECSSEMYSMRLPANAGPKNSPSGHHHTTLSGYIFTTKARIDNRKKLAKQLRLPTCPHNMVNFGPLAAEMFWRVWGTPTNFNGFRVLAALLHGTRVVGVSQSLRH